MSVTAVLDVGKTNVKLVLFDGPRPLWRASQPNRTLPGPPYPHVDVEAIWRFLLAGLRQANSLHRIDDIVVTTHGATMALVDADGLTLPVMDYEFAGLDVIEADYARIRPPLFETLSSPLPAGLNAGRQIFYQAREHAEAFAATRFILAYAQYFAWRLTGTARSEVTGLGCHTDLWQPGHGRLSSLPLAQNWQSLLPPLSKAHEIIGVPLPAILAETGLGTEVRVRVGIHDSNAALIPHLLRFKLPFTLISTGTWVVIMAVGAALPAIGPGRSMLTYVDLEARPVPAAMFMGGRDFAVMLGGAPAGCTLADLAAVLDSGASALPSPATTGSSLADRAAGGQGAAPAGVSAAARASLYCALMTDRLLDTLAASSGPLLVEGNFAANAAYCGALATLRPGQEVLVSADSGGSAYGASLLASWPGSPGRGGGSDAPMASVPPCADREALLRCRAAWQASADDA